MARRIRVYTPQPLSVGEQIQLSDDVHRHVVKVLRLRVGDALIVFNGEAKEYQTRITVADKNQLEVCVLESRAVENESPLKISLYLALLKGEAMDFAIQKSVELGVSRIIPIDSERSERQLNAQRLPKRMTHWRNIVIASAQQCGRSQLPELSSPMMFDEAVNSSEGMRIIMSPHDASPTKLSTKLAPQEASLLVGPEGGFSEDEVAQACAAGWQPQVLGPRILRADTAVVSGLTWLQYIWGDLHDLS
ncbi:16S rRNA (uracil(1498)-N(3))-methyltransferase [Suttonella sp. R2A3]|uniref:16S rRNA (uracil(1498)-N(3))-methyltransferase n=1 Tax=Suttonella sp. R2A3 TaxID=2908648 RepID=UPI001F38A84A|nr:16S rRNA (uracil(1498)-N(3))-methyltransferase [Suttonella sp. R2A3]UJF24860.1 16S rRNA (uracil(1498)-N(3))-methyltransferase [Suttonella sp. R2A3]